MGGSTVPSQPSHNFHTDQDGRPALPSPPFLKIDGMHNFRDCGVYPISTHPNRITRRGILYRSADPTRLTEQGVSQLRELKIARAYDLRSDREIEESTKKGYGRIRVWEPAQRISAPVFTDIDYANGKQIRRDELLRSEGDDVGLPR